MALGLFWGQARFRKLGRVSTLQRDRVWKSLTHRRGRVGVRSDGVARRRVASILGHRDAPAAEYAQVLSRVRALCGAHG